MKADFVPCLPNMLVVNYFANCKYDFQGHQELQGVRGGQGGISCQDFTCYARARWYIQQKLEVK